MVIYIFCRKVEPFLGKRRGKPEVARALTRIRARICASRNEHKDRKAGKEFPIFDCLNPENLTLNPSLCARHKSEHEYEYE